jgi:hypothetical protein
MKSVSWTYAPSSDASIYNQLSCIELFRNGDSGMDAMRQCSKTKEERSVREDICSPSRGPVERVTTRNSITYRSVYS